MTKQIKHRLEQIKRLYRRQISAEDKKNRR